MSGGAVIAAAAAARQRRIQHVCDAFRVAGATAPERARPLGELGLAEGGELAELERAGVVRRERGRNAWYLDEATWIARRDAHSSRTAKIALVIVIATIALLLGVAIAVSRANRGG